MDTSGTKSKQDDAKETIVDPDSVYDFYVKEIFPAILSSFPILLHRFWNDVVAFFVLIGHELYLFVKPTWLKDRQLQQQLYEQQNNGGNNLSSLTGDDNNYNNNVNDNGWLASPNILAQQLWEHAVQSSKNANATIAEFMLNKFDTNQDGHISPNELLNMTELLAKLPSTPPFTVVPPPVESFWAWFSREWPLMDWKIGVFLWQTFGGLLLVIAVLSVMPGRLHTMAGKILRWPILIVIYMLINVEFVVYVVIRLVIRFIETLVANPKHRALRSKMANDVTSYEEWYNYAAELDASQKRDRWQKTTNDSTSYQYNWQLIKQLVKDMREARSKKDPINALAVLQQCTRKNVGGIMNEDLFTKTYTGEPKFIVTEFIGEVTKTLYWVTDQTLLSVENDDQKQEDKILKQQQQRHHNQNQTQQQTLSYEQNLHQQSTAERNKLWGSLIAFATLNFHSKTEDGANTRSTSKIKTGKSQVRKEISTKKDTIPSTPTTIRQNSTRAHNGVNGDDNDAGNNDETTGFVSPSTVNREQLLKFLKRARTAYGKTALCLSGGSMMGLYHLGHLKGLMETDCLPHIVSGCSAGSVIGAVLCTRTNLELHNDLDPKVIGPHLKCFERSWPDRFASVWKNGNLFSGDDWLKMIKWFTYGDMTFEEAYQKTGRILCIALAATAKKTPPVLINYISAPNVTIASAVVASAAVPGFVCPQQLQIKDPDGTVRSAGPETYFDGSIRHDIPTAGLSEMLNCHFFVACQCNPHIVPLFFNAKGGVGRPSRWSGGEQETSWRGGFLLAALEMYLKNDMRAKFVFLDDLDAAVSFTGTMMTQSFEGSTTIVPQVELRDFFVLFSDPSISRLYHYLKVGSVAAYQHAAMIRCHYRIADALDECIEKLGIGRIDGGGGFESPKKVKISRRASFEFKKGIVDMQSTPQSLSESDSLSSSSETVSSTII